MAISLMRLAKNAEKKYNMKLVAGEKGMSNIVRWVHMVEDSQVPDFLHGNELVFTTGIGHYGNEWLSDFVQSLHKRKAAGLVVNLGPHIESIPSKAIVFCEQYGLPLFVLPWDIHIIDISYDFCRQIIANEKTETSIADAFRNLIFNPERKEGYTAALARYSFFEDAQYTVLAMSFVKNGKEISNKMGASSYLDLWRILRASTKTSAIFSQDNTLISVRQGESEDDIKRLINLLEMAVENIEGLSLKVGVSTTKTATLSVVGLYKEAVSALIVAKVQDKNYINYNDIGIYKLLLGVENRVILKEFCDSMLGKLYKSENESSDYIDTLKLYLHYNGSVKKMAEILNVHRNTINYKIKTIKRLLNSELTDEDKVNYQIAFYAKDILDT